MIRPAHEGMSLNTNARPTTEVIATRVAAQQGASPTSQSESTCLRPTPVVVPGLVVEHEDARDWMRPLGATPLNLTPHIQSADAYAGGFRARILARLREVDANATDGEIAHVCTDDVRRCWYLSAEDAASVLTGEPDWQMLDLCVACRTEVEKAGARVVVFDPPMECEVPDERHIGHWHIGLARGGVS